MLEEAKYIQNICDGVISLFGSLPLEGYIKFNFEFDEIDGEIVNFTSMSLGLDYSDYRKSTSDTTFEFDEMLEKNMISLRELMASKHKDGSKWIKATMSYKKGGAVDMDYEYPDQPLAS